MITNSMEHFWLQCLWHNSPIKIENQQNYQKIGSKKKGTAKRYKEKLVILCHSEL